jgi:hypothetical protein
MAGVASGSLGLRSDMSEMKKRIGRKRKTGGRTTARKKRKGRASPEAVG